MRTYSYKIPTRCPWLALREGFLIETDRGWGEVAPLPNFSRETLQEALEELLGKKESALPSVRFGLASAARPFPTQIRVPIAVLLIPFVENNAINLTRRQRQFLRLERAAIASRQGASEDHKLVATPPQSNMALFSTNGITPRSLQIPPGCTTLKLKLTGLSPEEAVSFVRPFVGRYTLRLDNNRKWSLEEALRFARHFQPKDFAYFEEPVRNLEELRLFAEKTGIPIALDEQGESPIEGLAARVVKPTCTGSLPDCKEPIVLSSAYESSVGILHIAALAKGDLPVGLDTFSDDLLDPPLKIEDGHLVWKAESACPVRKELLCEI